MPFVSTSQERLCFAKRRRGEAKGWDCEEWAEATPKGKKLPRHVKESSESPLAARLAARAVELLYGG